MISDYINNGIRAEIYLILLSEEKVLVLINRYDASPFSVVTLRYRGYLHC